MFNFLEADFPWITLAVIVVTVAVAGLIGYLLARQQYKELLHRQGDILAGEMRRLRRRAATSDQKTDRMRVEVERQRRKARR